MKKFATTLFMVGWVLLSVSSVWAQSTVTVSGWIADENNEPLMAATVVLLQPSDSVMVSFGISNEAGGFTMAKVPTGDYILQMAFMGFQDISQAVTIPEGDEQVELGLFTMQEKTAQLDEVTVTADHIPLLIRGDTVDYNARAFDTETNAVVEDLLRKLPGVEVDADGTIRAQGETVQQVLVDGKEFFGNDATVATRNLPADALERVQVYDKGSEASEFTGVDDGTRIKTIDLRLREDKKNGVFGKVGGGYGTQNVYAGNATVNRFGGGTQFSLIGASNNRNLPAFSMGDYIGFQGGLGALGGGAGGFSMEMSGMNPRNQSGITTSHAGGINFNHEFSESFDLRSSYFFNAAGNLLEWNTLRQSLLTDNAFSTEEGTYRTTGQNNHRGNVRKIWERPERSSLTFSTNVQFGGNRGYSENTSQTLSGEGILQNSQERTNSSEGQNHSVDSRATYRQLFAKPGRMLTFQGNGRWNARGSDLLVYANSRFAIDPTGQAFDTELLDQRQDEDQDEMGYEVSATYTEPLGRGRYLETAYRRGSSLETYRKDFFDRQDGTETLNTELSNGFTKRYITDRVGVSLRINRDDYGITTGVDFLNSQLSAELASDVPLNRSFMNFLPRLSGEYEFTTTKSLNFEYETTLIEPTLQQLQPVINNANPLVTVTGNPDLVPEYRHSVQLGYHSFSQLNFRSLFSMVSATYTRNKITSTQTIDEQFRQVIMPENTGDAWTAV
ncbi:MAG TPA: hypothetical protein DCR93_25720, partial [Cytophagales bacterium]|nr:hypothetical protein [Cytophagales bacterium]